jgi:peptide/nickel transport system ATP-binding protein
MSHHVLEVEGLVVTMSGDNKEVPVVNGISFHIRAGETLGVVGESGCGKSITSLSIMNLVPTPPGRIAAGQIRYNGVNLLELKESQLREVRGNEISMIFQEPMTSLNPVLKIGKQLDEAILLHQACKPKEARLRSIEMLKTVGIARAEQVYASYPFQLSGGMRQRVMIAMGLSCQPKLLIADEPTTALDVTIQAQILDLMRGLREKTGTSILFITHDLGVVAEMCDRVIVMYAGEIVEEANVDALFNDPKHPYTKSLLASIPSIEHKRERLFTIPGQVPPAGSIEIGCKFADRCASVMEKCRASDPEYAVFSSDHRCRCWLYGEGESQ